MERLTRRNQDGVVALNCSENKAIDRLAAYEDTGLTPEEIREDMPDITAIEAKLDYYQQAEADGRLVVLPCKPDAAFYIWRKNDDVPCVSSFDGVIIDAGGEVTYRTDSFYEAIHGGPVRAGDIGKTIFLTRMDAEVVHQKEVKHGTVD